MRPLLWTAGMVLLSSGCMLQATTRASNTVNGRMQRAVQEGQFTRRIKALPSDGLTMSFQVDERPMCAVIESVSRIETTHQAVNKPYVRLAGVLGAGAAVLGVATVIDASNIPEPTDPDEMNPITPAGARGIGGALVIAGVAAAISATVAALRDGAESSEEVARFDRNVEPEPCRNWQPAQGVQLAVTLGDETVHLTRTDDSGRASMDLSTMSETSDTDIEVRGPDAEPLTGSLDQSQVAALDALWTERREERKAKMLREREAQAKADREAAAQENQRRLEAFDNFRMPGLAWGFDVSRRKARRSCKAAGGAYEFVRLGRATQSHCDMPDGRGYSSIWGKTVHILTMTSADPADTHEFIALGKRLWGSPTELDRVVVSWDMDDDRSASVIFIPAGAFKRGAPMRVTLTVNRPNGLD